MHITILIPVLTSGFFTPPYFRYLRYVCCARERLDGSSGYPTRWFDVGLMHACMHACIHAYNNTYTSADFRLRNTPLLQVLAFRLLRAGAAGRKLGLPDALVRHRVNACMHAYIHAYNNTYTCADFRLRNTPFLQVLALRLLRAGAAEQRLRLRTRCFDATQPEVPLPLVRPLRAGIDIGGVSYLLLLSDVLVTPRLAGAMAARVAEAVIAGAAVLVS